MLLLGQITDRKGPVCFLNSVVFSGSIEVMIPTKFHSWKLYFYVPDRRFLTKATAQRSNLWPGVNYNCCSNVNIGTWCQLFCFVFSWDLGQNFSNNHHNSKFTSSQPRWYSRGGLPGPLWFLQEECLQTCQEILLMSPVGIVGGLRIRWYPSVRSF